MRLLLDTHTLIWWTNDAPQLSGAAREAMLDESNEILVSAASAMEIATKHRLGKLPAAARLARNFKGELEEEGFGALAISIEHAAHAGALAIAHKDPFDRLLIAQAQIEGLTLVSNELLFDAFGVQRLW